MCGDPGDHVTADSVDALTEAMWDIALGYPGVTEGISCAGTAIESRTAKVGKRGFLFLRRHDARVKVTASLEQLQALAAASPDQYDAGKGGWVKIVFQAGAAPELEDARRWIDESYRGMATKTLLKQLDPDAE
jgi:hypothetical protein